MDEVIKQCPICGSSSIQEEYILSDYWLNDLSNTYSYSKCQDCGLIFAKEPFSEKELDNYYNSSPVYSITVDSGNSPLIPKDLGLKRRSRIITKSKRPGRLLDIGCGHGEFMKYMHDKLGWEVSGIEVNRSQVDSLTKQFGLDVRLGNVESAGFEDGEFDVITLWDVIEHLLEPRNELLQIQRILKTDGMLVIRVPNANSWDAILFKKFWAGLDAPRHNFAFSLGNLLNLLTQTGYKISTINSRIGSYLNFVKSIEFVMNAKGVSAGLKRAILGLLRSPILRILTAPFTYLIDTFHKGTSLTVTAIKMLNDEYMSR